MYCCTVVSDIMTPTAPPTTLAQTTVEPADPDPCLVGNYVTFDAENERSPLYVKPSSEPWLCDRCARAFVVMQSARRLQTYIENCPDAS